MNLASETKQSVQNKDERVSYEAPAIIYEGFINTRAGTPIRRDDGVDPAELFGE